MLAVDGIAAMRSVTYPWANDEGLPCTPDEMVAVVAMYACIDHLSASCSARSSCD